jgi:hypothetical protein
MEQLPTNVTLAGKANGHLHQVHAHAALYHAKSVLLERTTAVVRVMTTLLYQMDIVYAIAVSEIWTKKHVLPNAHTDIHLMQTVFVVIRRREISNICPGQVAVIIHNCPLTVHVILQHPINGYGHSMVLPKALISETLSLEEISLFDHGSFQAVVNSRIKDTTKTCTLLSSVWKLKFGTATPHGNTLIPLVI